MIAIDRNRKDSQGKSIKPNAAWHHLAKDATRLAKEEGAAHEARDTVYGHVEVRKALEELFYRKCAYCETQLSEVNWDVEHYRPKGRVLERQDHPGYYWLAYTWENFLPSCAACNQRRRDAPTWTDPVTGEAAGKLDQFPLLDESTRAMKHTQSLANEKPLLLNPCNDDPSSLFRFDPLGQVIEAGGGDRLTATVRICNLKRKRLRDARFKIVARTRELLETIREARTQGNLPIEGRLKTILENSFLHDSCIHAAVARDVVRDPVRFGILNFTL